MKETDITVIKSIIQGSAESIVEAYSDVFGLKPIESIKIINQIAGDLIKYVVIIDGEPLNVIDLFLESAASYLIEEQLELIQEEEK